MVRVRQAGLSLTETVIALFVLVSGILAVFNLYTSALRYTQKAQERTVAVTLAQAKMDELRGWAQRGSGSGHNWNDWSSQVGSKTDPDFPGYKVTVKEKLVTLDSPNTRFEAAYLAADKIQARNVRRVTVEVEWINDKFSLVSLIAQPRLEWGTLKIKPVGGVPDPVPADAQVDFKVEAKDSSGNIINDLTYTWTVVPKDGNGSVTQNRVGSEASFFNRVKLGTGFYIAPGGECTLEVTAFLSGEEKTASFDLNTTANTIPWSGP